MKWQKKVAKYKSTNWQDQKLAVSIENIQFHNHEKNQGDEMLNFVANNEANEQINKIYLLVKKMMSSTEIAEEFNRLEIKKLNDKGIWSGEAIQNLRDKFELDSASPRVIRPSLSLANSKQALNEVIITDVKMPFQSMVLFMVKWVLASIPAFIILALVGALFSISIGRLMGF